MSGAVGVTGRELDAEIARVVFGRTVPTEAEMRAEAEIVWRTQPNVQWFVSLGGFHAFPKDDAARENGFSHDGARFDSAVPDYSTDIGAAFGAAARAGVFDHRMNDCLETTYMLGKNASGEWEIKYRYGITVMRHESLAVLLCQMSLALATARATTEADG